MSAETLTVALDGEVSLENFSKAINGLLGVVRALSTEAAPGKRVDWVIEDLEYGSAIVSVRPKQVISLEATMVIATQFLGIGRALIRGDETGVLPAAYRAGHTLLLAAPSGVRFETADDEVIIGPGQNGSEQATRQQPSHSYGTVRGTVQTLSRRKGVRFTLYDAMFDKPVSCYLAVGQEDMVKDYWGRRVSVSGYISRDGDSGVPLSIRNITDIALAEPSEPGSWRKAGGILRGVFDMPSEDLIRGLRDA